MSTPAPPPASSRIEAQSDLGTMATLRRGLWAAAALLVRRDLGAGVLATRLGPATAPAWLRSPLALAWRLQRGALLGWAIGAAVAGLSFGVLAQDMAQFAAEDPETAKMLATLGGSGSITDIYLAAILLVPVLGLAIPPVEAVVLRNGESVPNLSGNCLMMPFESMSAMPSA